MRSKAVVLAVVLIAVFLCASCAQKSEEPAEVKWREDVDPGMQFKNEAGQLIYVGMSKDDCEAVLGISLADDWRTELDGGNLTVCVADGVVDAVSLCGGSWKSGSGGFAGMTGEEVKSILGEPKDSYGLMDSVGGAQSNAGPYGAIQVLQYDIGGNGKGVLMCAEYGDVLRYTAAHTEYEDADTLGYRDYLAGGSGDASIENIQFAQQGVDITGTQLLYGILEINHYGDGPFSVVTSSKGESRTLADSEGNYTGRFPAVVLESLNFVVKAEGDWEIFIYRYVPMGFSGTTITGSGNYTTQAVYGEAWNVSYTGEGHFALKIFNTINQTIPGDYEEIILAESDGPYSGTIQWPEEAMGAYPLVIEAEGDWTIEKAG